MKRHKPWSDEEDDDSTSEESSSSDLEAGRTSSSKRKEKKSEVKPGKRKGGQVDFEALRRHGFKGGPSVLSVPAPKERDDEKDWSWSRGEKSRENEGKKEIEESYEERRKTRAAIASGEELATALTRQERSNLSFSQKEKRKRELGQASRGKNYVEEEKRLLRDNGVYSGFDT